MSPTTFTTPLAIATKPSAIVAARADRGNGRPAARQANNAARRSPTAANSRSPGSVKSVYAFTAARAPTAAANPANRSLAFGNERPITRRIGTTAAATPVSKGVIPGERLKPDTVGAPRSGEPVLHVARRPIGPVEGVL